MTDSQQDRITALEAKVQELDMLVNLALRLLAVEKPVSALLERNGPTEAEDLAVHAFLDDVARRAEQVRGVSKNQMISRAAGLSAL